MANDQTVSNQHGYPVAVGMMFSHQYMSAEGDTDFPTQLNNVLIHSSQVALQALLPRIIRGTGGPLLPARGRGLGGARGATTAAAVTWVTSTAAAPTRAAAEIGTTRRKAAQRGPGGPQTEKTWAAFR